MLQTKKYSYKFAKEILDTKPGLEFEIEEVLLNSNIDISILSRPVYNDIIINSFIKKGWTNDNVTEDDEEKPNIKAYFIKNRIGLNFRTGHPQFIGTDLLRFQIDSSTDQNLIDAGIYVTVTKNFKEQLDTNYKLNWKGSIYFEKVTKILPYYNHIITIPIYLIGIDIK